MTAAREALERIGAEIAHGEPLQSLHDSLADLATIRAALAGRGEPVARRWKKRINCGQGQFIESDWSYTDYYPDDELEIHPNVTACEPLYAAPPASSGLTDEQIIAIRDEHLPSQGEPFDCLAFARAILAAAPK